MRENGYLRTSNQKYDLVIRFGDPDFLSQGITLLSEYNATKFWRFILCACAEIALILLSV